MGGTFKVLQSYLADGTKVSALGAGGGNGYLYLGSLIYRKQGESISLESAAFAGGRFVAKETADGNVMVPMFHVADHLGSVIYNRIDYANNKDLHTYCLSFRLQC